jgi:hypothetical protein
MRLAGLGLRTGTYWRGHLPASLHGAEVAAHRAVEADQRGRSVWSPHCWITVLSWVLAPTVPGDDAAGTAAEGPQEGQHGAEVVHRPHPAGWARQARASGVSSGVTVAGKASAASFFGSKTTVGGAGRGAGAQPGASERPSRSTAATSSSSAGGRRGSARSAATSRVTEPAAILTVTGSGGACAAGGRSAWWRRAGRRSDSGGPGPLRVRRPRWPSHRWRPVR